MGELSPGSTKRRWIPEGGEQKLKDKIHKESKDFDKYGKLPYTISKPPKSKKHDFFECAECGNVLHAPKNTVMVVCRNCGKAAKVTRLE